jgi:hypothetical protein
MPTKEQVEALPRYHNRHGEPVFYHIADVLALFARNQTDGETKPMSTSPRIPGTRGDGGGFFVACPPLKPTKESHPEHAWSEQDGTMHRCPGLGSVSNQRIIEILHRHGCARGGEAIMIATEIQDLFEKKETKP